MDSQRFIKEKLGLRLFSKVQNIINKDPACGDDIIMAAQLLRAQDDDECRKLFDLASCMDRDAFFDEYCYKAAQYEKKANELSLQERISNLNEMLEYSMESEYYIELACLYLSAGNKSRARRVLSLVPNPYEMSKEYRMLQGDLQSGTECYKDVIKIIDNRRDTLRPNNVIKDVSSANDFSNNVIDEKNYDQDVREADTISVDDADMDDCPEIIKNGFENLVGMKSVKQQLVTLYNRLILDKVRSENGGIKASAKGYNFVICGNPGTGKTTVARIIAEVLFQCGVLEKNVLIETDRSGLVGQYIGETAQKTRAVITKAIGGTLFIDEAYTLYEEGNERDFGKEAINTLLKDIEDNRGKYCVILAGYKDKMKNMIRKANEGFSSRFDYHIEIPDYSDDELYSILLKMASAQKLSVAKNAKEPIFNVIDRERVDDTFDNARFMRRLLDEAIGKQAMRLMKEKRTSLDDLFLLTRDDFVSGNMADEVKNVSYYLNELNEMIGLESVKKEIQSLVESIQIQEERKKRNLPVNSASGSYHMAFTGNPGTGKTTVARLFGKILAALGILKRGDVFVECSRAELVAGYQGQTAQKTKDVIYSALGGVLFIDEAYNLVNCSTDSFGMEALNTLLAEMENKRDSLVVIIAGYTKEIDDFMSANPGLRSRIPKVIEFPDYNIDELIQIFDYEMSKREYDLSNLKSEDVRDLIEKMRKTKEFGNARGVRNICDKVIIKQNGRIAKALNNKVSDSEMLQLLPEDLCI